MFSNVHQRFTKYAPEGQAELSLQNAMESKVSIAATWINSGGIQVHGCPSFHYGTVRCPVTVTFVTTARDVYADTRRGRNNSLTPSVFQHDIHLSLSSFSGGLYIKVAFYVHCEKGVKTVLKTVSLLSSFTHSRPLTTSTSVYVFTSLVFIILTGTKLPSIALASVTPTLLSSFV